MANIVQSAGRIANLQQFMLDNLADLNGISGVSVDKSGLVKKGTETVDDILGAKTAGAVDSILRTAGVDVDAPFNQAAQDKLSDFLGQKGLDPEQAKQFAQDVANVVNDKELGPLYEGFAGAGRNAAPEEEPAPVARLLPEANPVLKEEPAPVPVSPEHEQKETGTEQPDPEPVPDASETKEEPPPPKDNGSEVMVVEDSPLPDDIAKMLEEGYAVPTGISTMALNPDTPVNEHGVIVADSNTPRFEEKDFNLLPTGTSTMAMAYDVPVNQYGVIVADGNAPSTLLGDDFFAAISNGTATSAYEAYGIDGQEDLPGPLYAQLGAPSPGDISVPFMNAVDFQVTSYTFEDTWRMERNNPDDEQKRIIDLVRGEYTDRLDTSEEYQSVQQDIAAKKGEIRKLLSDQEYLIRDTMKTMKLIDRMRGGGADFDEADIHDVKVPFSAVIDGEKRFFDMSMNDFKYREFDEAKNCSDEEIEAMGVAIEKSFVQMRDAQGAVSNLPVHFTAMVDGEEREFNLNLNQIRDREFEGTSAWKPWDWKERNAIQEAGFKAFNEQMSSTHFEPDDIGGNFSATQKRLIAESANNTIGNYNTLVEQYEKNIRTLVGEENFEEVGVPLDEFEKHFNSINAFTLQNVKFNQSQRALWKELRGLEEKAEGIKQDIYNEPVDIDKSVVPTGPERAVAEENAPTTSITSPSGLTS